MEKKGIKGHQHRKKQAQTLLDVQESQSQSRTRNLNKKIQKIHRKKKGKICRNYHETPSLISELLNKMRIFLASPKQEILAALRGKFNRKVHVKNIIDKDVARCFAKPKEDLDDCIRNYKELIALIGDYPCIEKVGLKSLKTNSKIRLSYLRDQREIMGRNQVPYSRRPLNPNEVTLIQRRQQLMSQIVSFVRGQQEEKGYPLEPIDEVLLEVLTLCKLNAATEAQIIAQLERLLSSSSDPLFRCHESEETMKEQQLLKQQYASLLVIKNLRASFNETPIDFFNYHMRLDKYQENTFMDGEFARITTLEEFKDYASNKKPKYRKSTNFLLKTPCSACFSDISQLSNPILNCPECHMRVHQHCQNLENRCHRCKYSRTSNLEKEQSSYCYICHRDNEKGTMIQTVTNQYPHQYAHNYCLLLHKFWTIEDQVVRGQYVLPQLDQGKQCQFCLKSQGHFFECCCCAARFHGMCAFLQGCSFRMDRAADSEYKVEISCCIDPEVRQRLYFQRKFKLNWEKVIFRQDKQLFRYIARLTDESEQLQ